MRITEVEVIPFTLEREEFEGGGSTTTATATQTLTRIGTDEGVDGYCLGGGVHGDRDGLSETQQKRVERVVESRLVGEDPFDREKFWRWMWGFNRDETTLSVIDIALWDLQGRALDTPVHKLAGGCRERVKAYASTFPNMGSPSDYADHAETCRQRGYTAYKIHPYYGWDPKTRESVPSRPSHVEHDLEACRQVNERVGDEMDLLYDPWGTYGSYEEALRVGRELQEMGFAWYEQPMNEYRVDSYEKLSDELDIPVLSPEIANGSIFTRADWIARDAADMVRIDALRGGITGCLKMAAICEAYNVRCEIHMSGFANLQVLAATSADTCEYYERGLLAPAIDYEAPPPYLEAIPDPLDDDGYVHVPRGQGMGYELDMEYINAHRID